ncbi:MAG: hypothetical protein OXN84_08855, partial [Albidovulum sp.]|nr:hypothetical protein [Albidovulum sp.]
AARNTNVVLSCLQKAMLRPESEDISNIGLGGGVGFSIELERATQSDRQIRAFFSCLPWLGEDYAIRADDRVIQAKGLREGTILPGGFPLGSKF